MDGSANRLGDYLRARRELVRPEDVGLPNLGRRRVPGLRREELALLAGISGDYYLRLEQGRDQHPSAQVLDAIARALQLDADATAYLHQLARPAPRRRATTRTDRVPPGIAQLIAEWHTTPAYVQNRFMDVVAANRLAVALSPSYSPGSNLLRSAFLDPEARKLHLDHELAAEEGVAALRALVGTDLDDPRLVELVGELSLHSERFRRLWARHDVRRKRARVSRLEHPQVGPLQLRGERLTVDGTDGLVLVALHAEPGSHSADSLALLASLTASTERPERAPATRPEQSSSLDER
ncbi:helix-turn-helix transcriptional regulator [Micromonospora sp. NPDC049559]|uniref:helix-turn-helix domain-containing protein n=1 Tax=Micromonospora sp. NPDC049559 TaxID=3155923 RepID=UPI003412AAA7